MICRLDDAFTLSLLTNDEVLAVNQKGAHGYPFWQSGNLVAWTAEAPDVRERYLAVFNTGERSGVVRVDWGALKLPDKCLLRDLWQKTDAGAVESGYTFRLAPHASGLYLVRSAR